MIKINCKVCDTEKIISDWEMRENGNYCSNKCYYISMSKKITRKCENCSKDFSVSPSRSIGRGLFCSRECGYDHKRKKLIGKKIGKITVVKYSGVRRNKNRSSNGAMFECYCECGNTKDIFIGSLTCNKVTSCGCKPSRHNSKVGDAAFNLFYNGYKAKSNERKIEFLLTKDEFKAITSLDCKYCGDPPKVRDIVATKKLKGQYPCNGVDRVDSNGIYEVKNCVSCCTTCNSMKMTLGVVKFLSHIEKIHNHQENKKSNFPISFLTVVA